MRIYSSALSKLMYPLKRLQGLFHIVSTRGNNNLTYGASEF